MAKKKQPETLKSKEEIPQWKLGDHVRIRYSGYPPGQIIELRGPLGPGGAQAYRVRIPRKPKPIYIDLLGDQLVAIPG